MNELIKLLNTGATLQIKKIASDGKPFRGKQGGMLIPLDTIVFNVSIPGGDGYSWMASKSAAEIVIDGATGFDWCCEELARGYEKALVERQPGADV